MHLSYLLIYFGVHTKLTDEVEFLATVCGGFPLKT